MELPPAFKMWNSKVFTILYGAGMSNYAIIQFVTVIIYSLLILIVIFNSRTVYKHLFLVFITAGMLWSLSSFLTHTDTDVSRINLWARFVPATAVWSIISYNHFICAYLKKWTKVVPAAGYAMVAVISLFSMLGYIPEKVTIYGGGVVALDYGKWMYIMTMISAVFMVLSIILIISTYRRAATPDTRNRVAYMLFGLMMLVIFGIVFEFQPLPRYPIDHIGHLLNAAVITLAVIKYRLLDVNFILRKGLAYATLIAIASTLYLVILSLLHNTLPQGDSFFITSVLGLALMLIMIASPFLKLLEKGIDRLFYGSSYDYRQTVLNFTKKKGSILDINALAEHMLKTITRAVGATQALLLLPKGDTFNSIYAEKLLESEPVVPVYIRTGSPIIDYLGASGKPLSMDDIEIKPAYKGIWEAERNLLQAARVKLLFPIINKNKLIAVLAISKKQNGFYSSEDIELIATLASDIAASIENAQLYAQAQERANTDELTGLYNHRYFHQRLEEEIARCSRFGEIFSLLFVDLDLFKSFNDIYGHLSGDDLLRKISVFFKNSIRGSDIGFRYGGDEFAFLLPQTSMEAASIIAERLRQQIGTLILSDKLPITCSIGISSWPRDGVLREEIIHAADTALYQAKQLGRNRTCLTTDIQHHSDSKMARDPEREKIMLSTIYALAATVEAKDVYTFGHSKKVSEYSTAIAQCMDIDFNHIESLRIAGLLHDIGKIGIPDRILGKPGPLTNEEWEPMRAHPNIGISILKHIDSLSNCLAAIQYHHERWDGTGYPSGLKGENIPLDARIIAVADAYDAMTSFRPYRHGKKTPEQALSEIRLCSGTQFDPVIVSAFVKQFEDKTVERMLSSLK
jgi:diguanylate cyclase (GGDEF)-like protein